jgi:hypothetical protein
MAGREAPRSQEDLEAVLAEFHRELELRGASNPGGALAELPRPVQPPVYALEPVTHLVRRTAEGTPQLCTTIELHYRSGADRRLGMTLLGLTLRHTRVRADRMPGAMPATVALEEDVVVVTRLPTDPDGQPYPAQRAGVEVGDRLVGIDGAAVRFHASQQLAAQDTGEDGASVTLTIVRGAFVPCAYEDHIRDLISASSPPRR